MLEKKLQEQLNRFNQINRYAKKMILEQDAPAEDPALGAVPPPPGGEVPPPPGGEVPPPPGGEVPPPPEGGEVPPPPGEDAPIDDSMPSDEGMDTTEEMDITDLVNMTKSIKRDMELKQGDNSEAITKMDDIFSKLDDLERKLTGMDSIISRIDELGSKVEKMKEPTPVEKLEMRSLDSYPFNKNPEQFFNEKRGEMERSGKNEYQIKPQDINNYSKQSIAKTFNPEGSQDDFRY